MISKKKENKSEEILFIFDDSNCEDIIKKFNNNELSEEDIKRIFNL